MDHVPGSRVPTAVMVLMRKANDLHNIGKQAYYCCCWCIPLGCVLSYKKANSGFWSHFEWLHLIVNPKPESRLEKQSSRLGGFFSTRLVTHLWLAINVNFITSLTGNPDLNNLDLWQVWAREIQLLVPLLGVTMLTTLISTHHIFIKNNMSGFPSSNVGEDTLHCLSNYQVWWAKSLTLSFNPEVDTRTFNTQHREFLLKNLSTVRRNKICTEELKKGEPGYSRMLPS
jgi:hypothetical protein